MLSHYRLVEKIGEGGMGVVWKALDTRLDRHIALKLLPPELTADPERQRRFLREARSAAAVTHPNIVTIHEIDEAGGITFIAMELVEGRSLRTVIGGQPIPIPEALRIATGIAEGLARAHQDRIVHRDLKPENVILGSDGRPRILDFGLAKLVEHQQEALRSQLSLEKTRTGEMTREGKILGTPAYMSPEQARGEVVDARSDIFSFGVTLYEMVTGRLPFQGDSPIEMLAAILHKPAVPASRVNAEVPSRLDDILGKCLEKDAKGRYHSSQDLVVDLRRLGRDLESGSSPSYGEVREKSTSGPPGVRGQLDTTARTRLRRAVVIGAGVAFTLGIAGLVVLVYLNRSAGSSERLEPRFEQLTRQSGRETQPSLSPDGKWMVYASDAAGNEDIYLQAVGGENPINLTKDSPVGDTEPAFSLDGEHLAFRSEREGGGIFVMGRTGESPLRIVEEGFSPSWSPDGEEIAYSTRSFRWNWAPAPGAELWAVKVGSGEKRRLFAGDAAQPDWSPHGQRVAFVTAGPPEAGILTVRAMGDGGSEAVPLSVGSWTDGNPVWSADGKHVYFISDRSGTLSLWRVPIDEESGKVLGEAESLSAPSGFVSDLAISADGKRIAFTSADQRSNIQQVGFDPESATVQGEPTSLTSGNVRVDMFDVTRDGEWVAYQDPTRGEGGVSILQVDGMASRVLVNGAGTPSFSPDGSLVAFFSWRSGANNIWRIRRDGTGLEQLTDAARDRVPGYIHPVYSPDGSQIAFHTAGGKQGNAFLLEVGSGPKHSPQPLPPLTVGGAHFEPWSWSPDGRRIAGNSIDAILRGTNYGIVVYSPENGTYEKLTNFGSGPSWLQDGRRLVFSSDGKLYLLDSVTRETRLLFSVPRPEKVDHPKATRGALFFLRSMNEADIWMAELQRSSGPQ